VTAQRAVDATAAAAVGAAVEPRPVVVGPRAGTVRRTLSRRQLPDAAAAMLAQEYRLALVACAEDADQLRIVYAFVRPRDDARAELVVEVPFDDAWVPSLARLCYPAGRFEREVRDLYGVTPREHPLPYRLVRHPHWPAGWYPMRRNAGPVPDFEPDLGSYPFGEVAGEGVYEIPVGPVHAGMIEPGHFRFSVVGETIIRMKARLWYLHRGVEKLFEGRLPAAGLELAERISGDTAVGHSLAYAMAVEQALGLELARPDALARALLLELERLHNHVSDLGAILNDVAFGIAHAHAGRIRERLLRINQQVTGHRLLRSGVVIGGCRLLELPDPQAVRECADRTAEIVAIALDHGMVMDRLAGTAVLSTPDARRIGVLGYVARASGLDLDARRDHPFVDLGPDFTVVTETGGDVLARLRVRAREVAVSADLVVWLTARLGPPSGAAPEPAAPTDRGSTVRSGLSLVEAWRGTVCHRVELAPDGTVSRVKIVDPSFLTWPALPIALADTIVPDFPLANKSFNQSYAGNDL
jgi:Ni,Fe-hydrogenase III large subunit/Ni,Fe-hydrogenase III component G